MSLVSMTGYGKGEANRSGLAVTVEISSVNRRQFDAQVRLPRSLATLEAGVLKRIHKLVQRGRVQCNVTVHAMDRAVSRAVVDADQAAAYVRALRRTAKKLGLRDDLTAGMLIRLPDVVRQEELGEDTQKVWRVCRVALGQALEQLVASRRREGAALERDTRKRLGKLTRALTKIRARAPAVQAKYRRGLKSRLSEAGYVLRDGDDRLARELLLFAEKSDSTEEATRLESHLARMADLLDSGDGAGRELDFLCQELLREINTIGAKANDALLQKQVIAFKTELDRIREQIQNVE